MGLDKALIQVDGRALALRVADEVAKVCGTVSLVGDPSLYGLLGLPVVPDRFPGQGPLAGIEAALAATKAEWNLIVACDMPALDLATLGALFAAGDDSPVPECVLPQYEDGRVEPLCAVFNARCHKPVLAALRQGVRKVTDALDGLALRYVRVTSDLPFANLNTPEDLRRYTREPRTDA